MKKITTLSSWVIPTALAVCLFSGCASSGDKFGLLAGDPLTSWNDTGAKERIIAFVEKVTVSGSPNYVPPEERIAVFDNDGTLWAEQPLYFQAIFGLDKIKELAKSDPELAKKQPYKALLEGDKEYLKTVDSHELLGEIVAVHANMTDEEFGKAARAWIETARHPRTGRLYTEMVYQPMLELLDYLRANGFQTWIVSGGGVDFMRLFAEEVYGVPPEQVIGSSLKKIFEVTEGATVFQREAEISSIDDKEGKPVNIDLHIGRRPILAAGNSDGDLAMLQYTAAGDGLSLMLLVHHDDAEREYAYDRESPIGKLDKALDEAEEGDWTVISIKDDFETVFPEAKNNQ